MTSGSINIGEIQGSNPIDYYFKVGNSGDVTIKSGSIDIGSGKFNVTAAGVVSASDLTITGGKIKIGQNLAYVLVSPPLTIETYLRYRYFYKVGDEYILSGDVFDPEKTYYSRSSTTEPYFIVDSFGLLSTNSIAITGGILDIGDGAFSVDNLGNVTIEHGNINMEDGSINIGEIPESDPIDYYFKVDNSGDVTIKSGSINLTNDTGGNVLIDADHIQLGGINGVYLDSNGTIRSGRTIDAEGEYYKLNLHSNGKLDVGNGALIVTPDGQVSIYNGSLLIKRNSTDPSIIELILGNIDILSIKSCDIATITTVNAGIINSSEIVYAKDEYISNYLYFTDKNTVRLRAVNNRVLHNPGQTVVFNVDMAGATINSEAASHFSITVSPDVTILEAYVLEVPVIYYTYITLSNGNVKQITNKIYIEFSLRKGTTPNTTTTRYFTIPFNENNTGSGYTYVPSIHLTGDTGIVKDIPYYTESDTVDTLELKGALVPENSSTVSYTLGSLSTPWNKAYLLNGYHVGKSGYYSTDYINQSFDSLIKYEPSSSSTGSSLMIGVSSQDPIISNYIGKTDRSTLELHSQGSVLIKSYGTDSTIYGAITLNAMGNMNAYSNNGNVLIKSINGITNIESLKHTNLKNVW